MREKKKGKKTLPKEIKLERSKLECIKAHSSHLLPF